MTARTATPEAGAFQNHKSKEKIVSPGQRKRGRPKGSVKKTLLISAFTPPTPTIVYDTYWKFAVERQNIFFRRIEKPNAAIWTDDSILGQHKFTNAYRASDRVSQYLIRSVIYDGDPSPKSKPGNVSTVNWDKSDGRITAFQNMTAFLETSCKREGRFIQQPTSCRQERGALDMSASTRII